LSRNQVHNAWDIGLSIDANTDLYRTTIANYSNRGDTGLHVGGSRQVQVNYANTTISGFNDGVTVGSGSGLYDEGGNTVR